MDAPNFKDLFEIGKAALLANNSRLSSAVADTEGSDINVILSVGASMALEVLRYASDLDKALWLNQATGAELDMLAADRYNETRIPAAPSIGHVTFGRSSASNGAITIPVNTVVLNSKLGIEYLTLEETGFGELETGDLTAVRVRSRLANPNTVSLAGEVDKIVSNLGDANISVVNTAKITGGSDAEADDNFRDRLVNYYFDVQRGTITALEYAAKTLVPQVKYANAFEREDGNAMPYRYAELIIADSDGECNAAMITAVTEALDEWSACGIWVHIIGGTVVYEPITVSFSVVAGYDSVYWVNYVRQLIMAFVNGLEPEAALRRADITGILYQVKAQYGSIAYGDNPVSIPAADITVTEGSGQVIRTTIDRVTLA